MLFHARYVRRKWKGRPEGSLLEKTAYELWEKAGRPEGMADHFWHEAQRTLAEPECEWACGECGASCYYDGRMGDGPLKTCHCWNAQAVKIRKGDKFHGRP